MNTVHEGEKAPGEGKERCEMNKNPEEKKISPAVIARLSRYYRFLRELKAKGVERISSAQLSKMMDLTASQIRQDFNCFGGFGQQGYGYNVEYLYGQLKKLLGAEEGFTAVIIGTGNLGSALAHAQTFERRGITVTGLFDVSDRVVGKEMAGLKVRPVGELAAAYEEQPFDIAVLCVPKSAAQECADAATGLGVKALWNFTGIEVRVPDECIVENVHLGDSLLTLAYKLRTDRENGEK